MAGTEYKHFSHVHGLVYHQVPQATEVQCSGCKFPGSGYVYACWQCSYFLHEKCFKASRSLKHPSHTTHPLTLVPYPTYPSNSFYCDTCKLVGSGFSYCCSECEFDLHLHCASTPNQANIGYGGSQNLNPQPATPDPYHGVQNNHNVNFPPTYPPSSQTGSYYESIQQNTSPNPPPNYSPTPPHSLNPHDCLPMPTGYPQPIQQNSGMNPHDCLPMPTGYTQPIQQNAGMNPHDCLPMPTGYPQPNQQNAGMNPHDCLPMPTGYPQPNQQNAGMNPHDCLPMPTGYPQPIQHPQTNNSTLPNYNSASPSVPSTQAAGNVPVANNQVKPPSEVTPQVPNQATGPVRISLLSNPSKTKEITHFSHPHGLRLNEISDTAPKVCSGCEDRLTGSAYSCIESQCNFHLHKACFELPRQIQHKAHLDHPLKLLAKPPPHYTDNQFACNACLQTGGGFVYNCAICSFDLHVECVSLPESIIRPDHKHPLKLFYSNPVPKAEGQQEVTFICDVCQKAVHEIAWIYYCHECDFGTHLECAAYEIQPAQKTDEELVSEAEIKLAMLNILLNGAREP